ncbi:MAG: hypothetical protein FD172_2218 [Methylocystaceae bacterium]|nr:MAG: hypothetical protein FD172_2218 [Methylocystaceae bacterium]
MSCHRYSRMSSSGEGGSPWGHHGRMSWRPYEIAAVILGFFIFWPLGLAILVWKLWQRSQGFEGDFFAFAQEQGARMKDAVSGVAREGSAAWGGPSFMRSTGNVAFDESRSPKRSATSPNISTSCAAPATAKSSNPLCAAAKARIKAHNAG